MKIEKSPGILLIFAVCVAIICVYIWGYPL